MKGGIVCAKSGVDDGVAAVVAAVVAACYSMRV
jgi:hypothetical protein